MATVSPSTATAAPSRSPAPAPTSKPSKAPLYTAASLIPFALLALPLFAHRSQFIALLHHLRDHGPHYMPGSTTHPYSFASSDPNHPSYPTSGDEIVRVFTGVKGVDYMARVMNCFFGPSLRDDTIGALSKSFVGAMGVVMGLVYVEGEREWRGWRRVLNA